MTTTSPGVCLNCNKLLKNLQTLMGFVFITVIMWLSSSLSLGQIPPTTENPPTQVDEEIHELTIGTEHEVISRTAIVGEHYRWPDGVVPYKISKAYGKKHKILLRKGMKEIEHHTCVRFVRKRRTDADYLSIESRSGCATPVGRRGGKQVVSLDIKTCLHHGVIMHELLHALGFWHEHARHDRDDHVTVHHHNVKSGQEQNFHKHTPEKIDTLGTPYDFGSVMHYHPQAFIKSGRHEEKTIEPKTPGIKIGQRKRLSEMDIIRINRMYCRGHEGLRM